MAELDLIIFDDAIARDWHPFTLTRPAGELLLGVLTLRERLERVTGARCIAHISSAEIIGFDEGGAPPVVDPASLGTERTRIFLSSRCVLHWDVSVDTAHESTLRVGEQVAGWVLPAGAAAPSEDDYLVPATLRGAVQTLGGKILEEGPTPTTTRPSMMKVFTARRDPRAACHSQAPSKSSPKKS